MNRSSDRVARFAKLHFCFVLHLQLTLLFKKVRWHVELFGRIHNIIRSQDDEAYYGAHEKQKLVKEWIVTASRTYQQNAFDKPVTQTLKQRTE